MTRRSKGTVAGCLVWSYLCVDSRLSCRIFWSEAWGAQQCGLSLIVHPAFRNSILFKVCTATTCPSKGLLGLWKNMSQGRRTGYNSDSERLQMYHQNVWETDTEYLDGVDQTSIRHSKPIHTSEAAGLCASGNSVMARIHQWRANLLGQRTVCCIAALVSCKRRDVCVWKR